MVQLEYLKIILIIGLKLAKLLKELLMRIRVILCHYLIMVILLQLELYIHLEQHMYMNIIKFNLK